MRKRIVLYQVPILLVEDDPASRVLYQMILQDQALADLKVDNGSLSFLNLLESGWLPSIALLDYNLPNTTGIHILKIIRNYNTDVKAIAISAHSYDALIEGKKFEDLLKDQGFSGLITKPIDIRTLVFRLKDVLKSEGFTVVNGIK